MKFTLAALTGRASQMKVYVDGVKVLVMMVFYEYLIDLGLASQLTKEPWRNFNFTKLYAEKLVPQPQVSVAFGLLNTNPRLFKPST